MSIKRSEKVGIIKIIEGIIPIFLVVTSLTM